MELREIKLEDKNFLERYFRTVKEPLADTTFAMRFIWAEPLNHKWALINKNLCFFGFLKSKYVVWGPIIGSNKLKETFDACFDIVGELNEKQGIVSNPIAIYIPAEFMEKYRAANTNYLFGRWTHDYVYKISDLIELKGKNYKSKRSEVNIFLRNNDIEVEEFNCDKHTAQCLNLIEFWRQQKEDYVSDADKSALDAETTAAKNLVRFSKQLNVKGVVVKVEGKLIGVSLGEPLTNQMCSNIIEKTNIRFRGASEFIFREFAKLWPLYKFLNAQDDFGIEYLKNAKLSYHPVKLLKSYYLEERI